MHTHKKTCNDRLHLQYAVVTMFLSMFWSCSLISLSLSLTHPISDIHVQNVHIQSTTTSYTYMYVCVIHFHFRCLISLPNRLPDKAIILYYSNTLLALSYSLCLSRLQWCGKCLCLGRGRRPPSPPSLRMGSISSSSWDRSGRHGRE